MHVCIHHLPSGYRICHYNFVKVLFRAVSLSLSSFERGSEVPTKYDSLRVRFRRKSPLNHPEFEPSEWYTISDDNGFAETIDINQPLLIGFVDAAHAKDLQKRRSTTGVVITFCGGAIVWKSKTQSLTAGSSTEAEFSQHMKQGRFVASYEL